MHYVYWWAPKAMKVVFYYISWIDQSMNLNEGVIAFVAFLVGLGMQNFKGARRYASYGFFVLAIVFAIGAFVEGPTRRLEGVGPFQVELPAPFQYVHSPDDTLFAENNMSVIASDAAEKNSVQLSTGELNHHTPQSYLASRCQADMRGFVDQLVENDAINPEDKPRVVRTLLRPPAGGTREACWSSWHLQGESIDHYEVFVTIPEDGGSAYQYAHLHLRAESPNHILVSGDYRRMRDSLLQSAGIPPPNASN